MQRYYICSLLLNNMKINWDALGITTSVACAIHCAVLPLMLTSLPLFGVNIIHNHTFEYIMIALAFVIGVRALSHGYKNHHNTKTPILLFSAGILLLVLKEVWHDYATYFLIPAVALIVYAHYLNFRLCKKAGTCTDTGCTHQH